MENFATQTVRLAAERRELALKRETVEAAARKRTHLDKSIADARLQRMRARLNELRAAATTIEPPPRSHQPAAPHDEVDRQLREQRQAYARFVQEAHGHTSASVQEEDVSKQVLTPRSARQNASVASQLAETSIVLQQTGGVCNVFVPSGSHLELQRSGEPTSPAACASAAANSIE